MRLNLPKRREVEAQRLGQLHSGAAPRGMALVLAARAPAAGSRAGDEAAGGWERLCRSCCKAASCLSSAATRCAS